VKKSGGGKREKFVDKITSEVVKKLSENAVYEDDLDPNL